jgi:hypothetical protein
MRNLILMLVLALGVMSCDKNEDALPLCYDEVVNYNILGELSDNSIIVKDLLLDERFIASERYINDYHCEIYFSMDGATYIIVIHSQMGLTQLESFRSIFSEDISINKKKLESLYFN